MTRPTGAVTASVEFITAPTEFITRSVEAVTALSEAMTRLSEFVAASTGLAAGLDKFGDYFIEADDNRTRI